MSKTKLSEKYLLKKLTNYTGHADELPTISEREWVTYTEQTKKVDDYFLTLRSDVYDTSDLNIKKKDL